MMDFLLVKVIIELRLDDSLGGLVAWLMLHVGLKSARRKLDVSEAFLSFDQFFVLFYELLALIEL